MTSFYPVRDSHVQTFRNMKKRSRSLTGFQEKVYRALKTIPRGRTISYKNLAKLAGHPKACRAVGNALNRNPDPKTIPCHRVIKSDGTIGGFKKGTKKKISLLRGEGVIIQKRKVVL